MTKTSFLEWLIGFVFLTSFSLIITFHVMFEITSIQTLEPIVSTTIRQMEVPTEMQGTEIAGLKATWLNECSQNKFVTVNLSGEEGSIDIDCSEVEQIDNIKDVQVIIGLNLFNKMYYKEGNCGFLDCFVKEKFPESLSVLISDKGHRFFDVARFYAAGLTVLFGFLFVHISRSPSKIARSLGWIFVFMGSSFIFMELFKNKGAKDVFTEISSKIFSDLQNYFIAMFILGVVLVAIGYIWAYFDKK